MGTADISTAISANLGSIISATAAISGVVVGNLFGVIKETIFNRTKRRKDTVYLAIVVVSHLERFANGCSYVAFDDGTAYGQPAGEDGQCEVTTTLPEFQPLDLDVEWKVLPPELMYSILRIPDQKEQIRGAVGDFTDDDYDPPGHANFFQKRQRAFAIFGLQVSDLAKRLREHAGLPVEEPAPNGWSRDQGLRNLIETIDERRAAAERRVAEYQARQRESPSE